MEELARIEIDRITSLLVDFEISEKRIELLKPVIENTAFMKVKLDQARSEIEESSVVVEYDNGGGQKGIRENPIFKGYEALWKSYMSGMDKIFNSLPAEEDRKAVVEELKPLTMLEIVRNKKRAEA